MNVHFLMSICGPMPLASSAKALQRCHVLAFDEIDREDSPLG